MFGIIMGGNKTGDNMGKSQLRILCVVILVASGLTLSEAWKMFISIRDFVNEKV